MKPVSTSLEPNPIPEIDGPDNCIVAESAESCFPHDHRQFSPENMILAKDVKIARLQDQLATNKADTTVTYLENLLTIRDRELARYMDLHRGEKRKSEHLVDKVADLEEKLGERTTVLGSLQAKVDTMMKADQLLTRLQKEQRQLTTSTLALHSKLQLTKLVSPYSLHHTPTETQPWVRKEMASSRCRVREGDEKANIARLAGIVDKLTQQYSPEFARYVPPIPTNDLQQQETVTNPDKLPPAVPEELLGIWTFLEEPTAEEEKMYDDFLVGSPPGPIYSPRLPQPYVNWMRLNTNMLRNLPVPMKMPLYGCSPDPTFYSSTVDTCIRGQTVLFDAFTFGEPFGSIYGFHTTAGVMGVPDVPVHGYLCCPLRGIWVIAAEGG
eukprot:GFUD01022602.1.p1 GENE.GFUD01022602.1~~GFUD01022602.1.p1  ORF type:complete len:404 (-),score=120.29 GFUD01022602.1:325-1470(-)